MSGPVAVLVGILIVAAAILLGAGNRASDRRAVRGQTPRVIHRGWALSTIALTLLVAAWALSAVGRS